MAPTRQFYDKHKLTEPCKYLYEYYVTGRGPFPYNMLRYDGAWPATSLDASLIAKDNEQRSILLYSHRPPTRERWLSFTWSVGMERL